MIVKFESLVRPIFLLGIFLLPFIFWPWAVIPYEIPRVWFVLRWIELLGVLGILASPSLLKRKGADMVTLILVYLFVLTASISSYFGVDFSKSFWGNYYRGDGLITLFHLAAFFFFLVLFWDETWRWPTILTFGLSCFLLSLWGVLTALLNPGIPIGLSFGQPNFLTGYLLICLPFALYLYQRARLRKERVFWLLAVLIQAGAVLLTFSWAGIFGIVIFLCGWLIFRKSGLGLQVVIPLFLGLLMAVLFVFLRSSPSGFVAEGRERIFRQAFMAFEKRPIIGFGWANFDYAFESVSWPIKFEHDIYVDKAHSNLLEILITTGMVGLVIYLALLVKILSNLSEKDPVLRVFFFVFLLFLFHSQTNVISIAEELIFWLILGVSATCQAT